MTKQPSILEQLAKIGAVVEEVDKACGIVGNNDARPDDEPEEHDDNEGTET